MDKFTAIWQEADEEKRKEIRQMIRSHFEDYYYFTAAIKSNTSCNK